MGGSRTRCARTRGWVLRAARRLSGLCGGGDDSGGPAGDTGAVPGAAAGSSGGAEAAHRSGAGSREAVSAADGVWGDGGGIQFGESRGKARKAERGDSGSVQGARGGMEEDAGEFRLDRDAG